MTRELTLGKRLVGDGHPAYIVGEIGINHNGDIDIAKKLIDVAADAGCDAVKFQKRTPELCVPPEQRNMMRETPWGYISYLDYRYKVEFELDEYREINAYCRARNIDWFASCWDEPSVDFIEQFDPPAYKICSAAMTDMPLLDHHKHTGRPIILSSGMTTMEEIKSAVALVGESNVLLCHSTSTYPCPLEELNLRMIETLRREFPFPIGYSGHEVGLPTTIAAAAMGACYIERHITLDRSMWGSDQSASVEPGGLQRLVKYIRVIEQSMGDGVKKIYDSEKPVLKRLRRVRSMPSFA